MSASTLGSGSTLFCFTIGWSFPLQPCSAFNNKEDSSSGRHCFAMEHVCSRIAVQSRASGQWNIITSRNPNAQSTRTQPYVCGTEIKQGGWRAISSSERPTIGISEAEKLSNVEQTIRVIRHGVFVGPWEFVVIVSECSS